MAAKKSSNAGKTGRTDCAEVLAWIRKSGSASVKAGMARYGIPDTNAVGIPVGALKAHAKKLGKDHALAQELWATGGYEARFLACFIDDPALVPASQLEAWCREFSDWATCDTACFALFDRTPHAWAKVEAWASRKPEFQRRAAFALLASLTVHDKKAPDAPYLRGLELIEDAADDDRNFVKKAVNWALRSIGKRNAVLHAKAVDVSKRLAASESKSARWIGKDALRELEGDSVTRRLARKAEATTTAKAKPISRA